MTAQQCEDLEVSWHGALWRSFPAQSLTPQDTTLPLSSDEHLLATARRVANSIGTDWRTRREVRQLARIDGTRLRAAIRVAVEHGLLDITAAPKVPGKPGNPGWLYRAAAPVMEDDDAL